MKADRPHQRDESTHRQVPDNDSSLLFAALDKAEPLISTAVHQFKRFSRENADKHMDGRYQVHYLPASRLIEMGMLAGVNQPHQHDQPTLAKKADERDSLTKSGLEIFPLVHVVLFNLQY